MSAKHSKNDLTSQIEGVDIGSTDRRRQFLTDHHKPCTEHLSRMWTELKTESPESWQALRFKSVGDATTWACEQWRSKDFSPEGVDWPSELLPCEPSTFAVTDFWELLRVIEVQGKYIKNDSPGSKTKNRELGHRRHELIPDTDDFLEKMNPKDSNLSAHDALTADQSAREAALERFADKVLKTLDALATRVHSALPALWLEHQQKLRNALAGYFGEGLFDARHATSLPECVTEARPSARAKASSLALFRFAVLFASMSLTASRVEDVAFREIYLSNVENPPWQSKARDRWDVVPKAVAAARMQKLKFPVSSNQVREAARDRLGSLTREFMDRIRLQTNPDSYPAEADSLQTLLLELVLARDSITKTLQDEYARSDRPGASDGPSSAVIQHWHSDIDETLKELREHLIDLQEDPT